MLLIVIGITLLLPGLCSIFFIILFDGSAPDGFLGALWLVCLAISAGGILLIYRTIRGFRS